MKDAREEPKVPLFTATLHVVVVVVPPGCAHHFDVSKARALLPLHRAAAEQRG